LTSSPVVLLVVRATGSGVIGRLRQTCVVLWSEL